MYPRQCHRTQGSLLYDMSLPYAYIEESIIELVDRESHRRVRIIGSGLRVEYTTHRLSVTSNPPVQRLHDETEKTENRKPN